MKKENEIRGADGYFSCSPESTGQEVGDLENERTHLTNGERRSGFQKFSSVQMLPSILKSWIASKRRTKEWLSKVFQCPDVAVDSKVLDRQVPAVRGWPSESRGSSLIFLQDACVAL